MSRVSVLVPAYNCEKTLTAALGSLQNQTLTDFEAIVVNDGSKDSTAEIMSHFEKTDSRFKMLHLSKNGGVAKALNSGLALCQSQYIARFDSDDICLPNRLQAQVDYLESHPNIGVLGSQVITFGRKANTSIFPQHHDEIFAALMISVPIIHPTVMFNKSQIPPGALFYREGEAAEDFELWLRLIHQHKVRFENMMDVLLLFRDHGANVTKTNQSGIADSATKTRKQFLSALQVSSDSENFFNILKPHINSCHMVLSLVRQLRTHSLRWAPLWNSLSLIQFLAIFGTLIRYLLLDRWWRKLSAKAYLRKLTATGFRL